MEGQLAIGALVSFDRFDFDPGDLGLREHINLQDLESQVVRAAAAGEVSDLSWLLSSAGLPLCRCK